MPTLDAFEEGNMANISYTTKLNLSLNSKVIKNISFGTSCSLKEISTLTQLFQEF